MEMLTIIGIAFIMIVIFVMGLAVGAWEVEKSTPKINRDHLLFSEREELKRLRKKVADDACKPKEQPVNSPIIEVNAYNKRKGRHEKIIFIATKDRITSDQFKALRDNCMLFTKDLDLRVVFMENHGMEILTEAGWR